jgi:hypothetical protein
MKKANLRSPRDRSLGTRKPHKLPKEKDWNSRFVYEKLPDYNAMEDMHCIGFIASYSRYHAPSRCKLPKLSRSHLSKYTEDASQLQSMVPVPATGRRSQVRVKKLLANNPARNTSEAKKSEARYRLNASKVLTITRKDLGILRTALDRCWEKASMPHSYQAAMRDVLTNMSIYDAAIVIANELEATEKGGNVMQVLQKEAGKREMALTELIQFAQSLESNLEKLQLEETKNTAVARLLSYQKATYLAFTAYRDWRTKLGPSGAKIPFSFNNKNYIEKVAEDYIQLAQSPLKLLFTFQQPKPDVFLTASQIAHGISKYHDDTYITLDTSSSKASLAGRSRWWES